MKQTRHTIVRLLNNLGSRKEVEQYLKRFSEVESHRFAVVKAGGRILRDDLDSLASSLSFLYRVGLFPIVVHGGGAQLNEALEAEGIESDRVDGMRVTDAETLRVARKVFRRLNAELVDALDDLGTRARPIPTGVFEATHLDRERYGLVGEVSAVDTEPISMSIESGHLPILSPLAETSSGQILNVNADLAARQLTRAIEPFKIVFLADTGGLLDEHGKLISSVNLTEECDYLMEHDWLHSGMRLKLQQIRELLEDLPRSSSVSITRPEHLARELFTHRGSGTLVRRGERIHSREDAEEIDRRALTELLESSFQKHLVDDYFERKDFDRFYVTDSHRAAAVVTREGELPYLDKFGVTRQAQGEGLGHSIWMRLKEDYPALFWRSRAHNPINSWYFQEAEGSYEQGDWVVFWYGLDSFDRIEEAIERALSFPPTLLKDE